MRILEKKLQLFNSSTGLNVIKRKDLSQNHNRYEICKPIDKFNILHSETNHLIRERTHIKFTRRFSFS